MGQGHKERLTACTQRQGHFASVADEGKIITPLNDRVLIQRIEEKVPRGTILLTDPDKGIKGLVLAVGPGKWIEGTWWRVRHTSTDIKASPRHFKMTTTPVYEWEWLPGHREPLAVKPGMKVLFSSKWNDFASDHYDDLPIGAKSDLHLVQEADVLAVLNG